MKLTDEQHMPLNYLKEVEKGEYFSPEENERLWWKDQVLVSKNFQSNTHHQRCHWLYCSPSCLRRW